MYKGDSMNLEFNNENLYKEIEDIVSIYEKKDYSNLDQIISKYKSWDIFYNLSSARKNLICWYPFKKEASILEINGEMGIITQELCQKCAKVTTLVENKKQAEIISKLNKRNKKLEVVIGSLESAKLTQKYDYILINNNFNRKLLQEAKKLLLPYGKILITIDNTYGIKKWCQVDDQIPQVKTFSKSELEDIALENKMHSNFYYMFPDSKFPQVIYTDNSLGKGVYANYSQYYCEDTNIVIEESKLYKKIYNEKSIPLFANSYFVELSVEKEKTEVDFVKFNVLRKKEFNLYTLLNNGKYYKFPAYQEANEFLKKYVDNSIELKKQGFDMIEVKKDNIGFYTDEIYKKDFLSIIVDQYKEHGDESLFKNLSLFKEYIKKIPTVDKAKTSVFEKMNIEIDEAKANNLKYVKKLYIDIIPQNIICDKDKFYLIDQEWYMKNTPIEFLLYRTAISVGYKLNSGPDMVDRILEFFNIKDYKEEFDKLEKAFQNNVIDYEFPLLSEYNKSINVVNELKIKSDETTKLTSSIQELESENIRLSHELESIKNSKRWKLLNKIFKIFGK